MNKKIKAIIVIVLIILVIIGIWFYKNNEKKNEKVVSKNQNSAIVENNINNANSNNTNIDNTSANNTELLEKDFDLYADENFDLERLKEHKLPIILDFGADYCAPCREMKPILKKLNEEFRGKAIIKICDVMEYPETASGYDVSLIPTQIFINSDGTPFVSENYNQLNLMFAKDKNGNIVYTAHVGYLSEQNLRAILKEMK